MKSSPVLLFVVNEAYFFVSHRLAIAQAARGAGFSVHVASPLDHVWAPDDFRIGTLADHGITHHPIPLSRRGTNPFNDARTFAALFGLYRRLRPDIVHLLTVKPVLYGGLAARLAAVPAVAATITGLGQIFVAKGVRGSLLRACATTAYRLATSHVNAKVMFQNPEDLTRLTSLGAVCRSRTALIRGSGVDLTEFSPKPEPEGTMQVILPARMIWEKGIAEFVGAARQLKSEGIDARFALIGNTSPSNPSAVPEERLHQWADEAVVEWWGRREDMPDIMAQSHIVCLPSKYGEGVPKVLIEAAAAGRAIVTTDIPGCREMVRHDVNGLLVPPGDSQCLAKALRCLLSDPIRRARFGKAGREMAAAQFSIEQVVGSTLAAYDELLAKVSTKSK